MYKNIIVDNINFGFIIRKNFEQTDTNFITDKDLPLQFAYMNFKKGEYIKPHIHNVFTREINSTNEVLIIKRGTVKVFFFNFDKIQVHSELLNEGDIIFLLNGGHSFEFIENVELFEIKNGPYFGQEIDKIKF